MKKKNWLFSLFLAVIILPCMALLSACGENQSSFKVYIDNTIVSEDNKTINITYGDTLNLEDRIKVEVLNVDGTTDTITKGTDGYTLSGVPSVFNAGTYPITITYEEFAEITIDLVIAKANIDMANVEWEYSAPITFTGNEISVALSGVPTGVTPNYTGNTGTNVNDYTASVSFDYDTANYTLINNTVENLNWTISKANPIAPTALVGNVEQKLSNIALPEGWSWENSDTALTESGNYKANYAETANYNTATSVDVYIKVKQYPTFSAQTGLTATYGDTLEDIAFITSNSDTQGTWSWVLATTTSVGDVGTQSFSATYTPTDTENYIPKTITIDVVVNKKLITKPTLAQNTFTYDGNIKKPEEIGFDANVMTRTGAGAVEVGVGYIRFTLKDTANYAWADGTTARLEYEWTITPKLIVKPKVSETYTYNGTEQTVNITTSDYYTISGNIGTNAGSYTATLTLIDIYSYAWTDNSSTPYNLPWEILQATPTYTAPTSLTATFGDKLSDVSLSSGTGAGVWSWEDSTKSVGNIGTNSFNAIFTPTDTTNYKTETVAVNILVNKVQIEKPEIVGTYIYDGTEQTANIQTSAFYTISNNTRTNAGTQNVSVALNDEANYMWADGTSSALSLSWNIAKAQFTFSAKELPAFNFAYVGSKYYVGFDTENFTYANEKYDITCASNLSSAVKNSIIAILDLSTMTPYYFWYDENERKTTNLDPSNTNLKLCVPIIIGETNNNINITNMDNNNLVLLDYVGTIIKATPQITTNPTNITINKGDTLDNDLIINGVVKTQLANSLEFATTSLKEIDGTWAWETQNLKPTESGNQTAIFTPTSNCFNAVEVEIYVEVQVKEPALKQVGFDGIASLASTTFLEWYAGPFQLVVGDADLTVAQFNDIINYINTQYGEKTFPTWEQGKYHLDENNFMITNNGKYKISPSDWTYSQYTPFPYNEYNYGIQAFQIVGTDTIKLSRFNINPVNQTYVNKDNPDDIIKIMPTAQLSGNIIWGDKQGNYELKGNPVINEVCAQFTDETSASGTISLSNRDFVIEYGGKTYNFIQKADFDVDIKTGISLQLYDVYNNFKTNGKFRVSFNYRSGYLMDITCSEWSNGNGENKVNYASMKLEMYTCPIYPDDVSTYVGIYEAIYNLTNNTVELYYTTNAVKYYKQLPINDYLALVNAINNYWTTVQDLYNFAQCSNYCFGIFQTTATPLTSTDYAKFFTQIGEIQLEDKWHTIEGYTSYDGYVQNYYFDDDGNMSLVLPYGTYLTTSLNFDDIPEVGQRAGYSTWAESNFNTVLQSVYNNLNRIYYNNIVISNISFTANQEVYESTNSDYELKLVANDSSSGTYTWGENSGTYELTEQTPATDILNITIIPTGGTSFSGTLDKTKNEIKFTIGGVEYTFTKKV